ncbi:MAG TPA: 2-succinyl-5-enolpyruvyl-6-hydroxy-3-cyclohexene-1-carboxylic-acid synthase [Luteibaculaceae bacterium]|nr:2-succinyl-5-enolpyruvyl-6-hydroxy-3-cyclohexene-1-carboxylic-acid synthase [Luteibaculaceae bacterium]
MNTNNPDIITAIDTLYQCGVRHFVFSPGSRNAPILRAIRQHADAQIYPIVDERSAAFFGLGISQYHGKPAVLICTSGSALLNYGPALAEAFYQGISLIALSADRPKAWIDQADGQAIRQDQLFASHTKYSKSLMKSGGDPEVLWYNQRTVNEAVEASTEGKAGPVHLNIPLSEPLYQFEPSAVRQTRTFQSINGSGASLPEIPRNLLESQRILILVGQLPKNELINRVLGDLSLLPQAVILTETTSNVFISRDVSQIDNVLNLIPRDAQTYQPEILITLGGMVVSKKIKQYLRKTRDLFHLHIGSELIPPDTYQALQMHYRTDIYTGLSHLRNQLKPTPSDFGQQWLSLQERVNLRRAKFQENVGWSDFAVYAQLLPWLPVNTHLQLGNSSVIRYAQLFEKRKDITYFANRGVSGIDGCTSTAVGYASQNKQSTVLISGDLSFLYDANGLWNAFVPNNFVAFVINNGGGNIFRIIDGPTEMEELETYIESHHQMSVEPIAHLHGFAYFSAKGPVELRNILNQLRNQAVKTIVEIFTDHLKNPIELNAYWEFLKQ